MRVRVILLAALLLAGCGRSDAMSSGGIVSTNPCADAMLVKLVAPDRIAAISRYSQEAAATSIPLDVARQFHVTAGTAEEVLALKPDLVVTSSFTPAATRAAYARAGLQVLTLGSPTTIADSKAQIMQLAQAVGRPDRGRAMVARIDRALAATRPGDARRPAALLYIGGDLVTGAGTLLDEMMTHVGLRDAAAGYGLAQTGQLPLETLIAHPPALILSPGDPSRSAALRNRLLAGRTREMRFPRTLINCGGPVIAPALERLAAARAAVLQ